MLQSTPLRESRPRDLGVTAFGRGLVSSSKVDGFYRHYTSVFHKTFGMEKIIFIKEGEQFSRTQNFVKQV
jgi:hypothetical protein